MVLVVVVIGALLWQREVSELPQYPTSDSPQTDKAAPLPEAQPEPTPWTASEVTVGRGATIAKLLQDQGLEYSEALQLVEAARPIHNLERIRLGETLIIRRDQRTERVVGLVYPLDRYGEQKMVLRRGSGAEFVARREARTVRLVPKRLSGVVTESLWATREQLGLSAENIVALAGVFEWEVDFNTQVREGDTFRVVLDEVLDAESGERLRYGTIHAAEYVNAGQIYRGIRYVDSEDKVGYFNEEGMSTKKMFLKSPLKFSRISSGFSRKRFHPVLKKWRAHNGVDYAAGRGTPVRAIGRGKVVYAGTKGGYGKHVRVRHNARYSSSYSHLSRIAVKRGQMVDQGQLVGKVGSTGLATGPHLHFEFYVNGGYTNFLAQKFPRTEPIADSERDAFNARLAQILPLLVDAPSANSASPEPASP